MKGKKKASVPNISIILWAVSMLFSLVLRAQPDAFSAATVLSTNDLSTYQGSSTALTVTDSLNGGLFLLTHDKLTPDYGVVFPAATKGAFWQRRLQPGNAVSISWFVQDKPTTDDGVLLKRALHYINVVVDRPLNLPGKTSIPDDRTITITHRGSISVTDTFPLQFNAFLKAGDYQRIFDGDGKVVFGSRAVPYVSACWFGAIADCNGSQTGKGTDNTVAIQRAFDAATKVSDLYLPPTAANMSYRITGTIHLQKKLHFFSFRLHGGGTTLTHSSGDRATTIFADFSEGAAIAVQGSRRVYLNDFCLIGKNALPSKLGTYDEPLTITDKVNHPESFLSAGLQTTYAGITTDADADSKVWSADIVFDNLLIEHFYLGIGISQSGHVQGDRMRIQNSQINFCVFGVSLANHQNRACHLLNVDMNRVWCGVTNNTFAQHTGSEFQITGGQWCNMFKCFEMEPSYLGQCVISGLYAEAIGAIGKIGGVHVNNSSVLFTGCHFQMRDEGLRLGYAFTPPFYTLWASANVTFEGCNFVDGKGFMAMNAITSFGNFRGAGITLNGCTIHNCDQLFFKGNSLINNTYLIPNSNVVNYNRSIMVDFEHNERHNTGFSPECAISGMENAQAESKGMSGVAPVERKVPRFYKIADAKGRLTQLSLKKDTLHLSYDQALVPFFRDILPGDFLGTPLKSTNATSYDNPTMRVLAIDTARQTLTTQIYTDDYLLDKIASYTNGFFTIEPISGVVQDGSAVVTHINTPAMLQRGDYITFNGTTGAYRILSVNSTDSSCILNQVVATNTNGRVALYNEVLHKEGSGSEASQSIRTLSQGQQLLATDETIIVKGNTTDITLTLPANVVSGYSLRIKRASGVGKVAIQAKSGTIDGNATFVLGKAYDGVTLLFDGQDYLLVK